GSFYGPLCGTGGALKFQLVDGRHGRIAEQLRHHDPNYAIGGVGSLLSEEDQVVCSVLQFRGEGGRNREPVEGNFGRGELNSAIGAHAERLPDGLLNGVGAKGYDDDFALAGLLLELERGFDGPGVEVIHVELESGIVNRLPVPGNLESRFHVRNALDANGNLHRGLSK